jgi:hypothetical protein
VRVETTVTIGRREYVVEYTVTGRRIPATFTDPGEEPEVEVLHIWDDNGREIDMELDGPTLDWLLDVARQLDH